MVSLSRRKLVVGCAWLSIPLLTLTMIVFCIYPWAKSSLNSSSVQVMLSPSPSGRRVLSKDVTIVTAFLNIGVQSNGGGSKFSHQIYKHWMKVYRRLSNPVVAFFTDDEDINDFRNLRRNLPENKTKVMKVSLNETWAFSLQSAIAWVFNQSNYPKYAPNTIRPDYPCTMNAKYEFVSRAIQDNPFNTLYFAWMDLGYMRDIVDTSNSSLHIQLPPNFNHSRVGYTEVYTRQKYLVTAQQIVSNNAVWVGGGFFIGNHEVLAKMVIQYKGCVETMIRQGWVSTDQQVLYYMNQPAYTAHHLTAITPVQIQTYHGGWFHLGFLCLKEKSH